MQNKNSNDQLRYVLKLKHGIYSVYLPLFNETDAGMSRVCLEQITSKFPIFPLHGKVLWDIREGYWKSGDNVNDLPKILKLIGGYVDFIIDIKYLRYFPEQIFQLLSGLTIYKFAFKNTDSGEVIGGPNFTNFHFYQYRKPSRFNWVCSISTLLRTIQTLQKEKSSKTRCDHPRIEESI